MHVLQGRAVWLALALGCAGAAGCQSEGGAPPTALAVGVGGKADGVTHGWVECVAEACPVYWSRKPNLGPDEDAPVMSVPRGRRMGVYSVARPYAVVAYPDPEQEHAVQLAEVFSEEGQLNWRTSGLPRPGEAVVCTRALGCPIYSTDRPLGSPSGMPATTASQWTVQEARAVMGGATVTTFPYWFDANRVRVVYATDGWAYPSLKVPFVTQQPYGVACAAAVMSMGLATYGQTVSVKKAYDWFATHGGLNEAGYVVSELIPDAARSLSGGAVRAVVDWWQGEGLEGLRRRLNLGMPAHIFVNHAKLPGSGITTNTPHSVLVTGYRDGVFTYHNPWRSVGGQTIKEAELEKALLAKVSINYFEAGPFGDYVEALTQRDLARALGLYAPERVVVSPYGFYQTDAELTTWFSELLGEHLPGAVFTLEEVRGRGTHKVLRWTATTAGGEVRGEDTFGLFDGRIRYQSTSFTAAAP